MALKTFQNYCEAIAARNPVATVGHRPDLNRNFAHPQYKSFEQVVDPLINDFIQKVLYNVLSGDTTELESVQVEYILHKIKEGVLNLRYAAKNDLGNIINALWKNSNRQKPVVDTPKNATIETPLEDFFKKRR